MADEYYKDEYPYDEESGSSSGGSGSGFGGFGSGWGGGGGSGSGSGGGLGSGWGNGSSDNSEEDNLTGAWGNDDEIVENAPYLKLSSDGSLLTCDNQLLLGDYMCNRVMPIVCYADDKGSNIHKECFLIAIENSLAINRTLEIERFSYNYPDDYEVTDESSCTTLIYGDIPLIVGEFDVYARWQSGHYDHSEVNSANFTIYDVYISKRVYSKQYTKVAHIKISDNYQVYVDGLAGRFVKS